MICPIDAEGNCARHKTQHVGRLREISQMDNEVGEKYRQHWDNELAGGGKAQAPQLLECRYRGQDTGTTKECASCGVNKTKLKIFRCHCPAREPDEVTYQDCRSCAYLPKPQTGRPLILFAKHSPGDMLVMTAAIYSLHRQHPGKFRTAVKTPCNEIFEHNPDICELPPDTECLEMNYPLIHQSNQRAVHFMQGYCDFLEEKLGVRVPLLTNRPHVYLSNREKSWMSQVEEVTKKPTKFWLICAGRKSDYTTKFWGTDAYQAVVDRLRGRIQFVQIGSSEHHHPPLRNVLNLVGKTDLRMLIRLAWHAQGGVGGVTFLQHLMAAHEKPYMCIMGGREAVSWNSYQRQHLFHTIGMMPCCRSGGCWRSRVTDSGDGDEKNKSLCEQPVIGTDTVPRCMAMIGPDEVAERISQISS